LKEQSLLNQVKASLVKEIEERQKKIEESAEREKSQQQTIDSLMSELARKKQHNQLLETMCNSLTNEIAKLTEGGNEGARRNRQLLKTLGVAGGSSDSFREGSLQELVACQTAPGSSSTLDQKAASKRASAIVKNSSTNSLQ